VSGRGYKQAFCSTPVGREVGPGLSPDPCAHALACPGRTTDYRHVREFLVRFEEERKDNRSLVKENPKDRKIKREFVEYDQFNRHTNDLASHQGRLRILNNHFKTFLGTMVQ
jgi:hypothetical protein